MIAIADPGWIVAFRLPRMSELFSRHTVLTVDQEDFVVDRRHRSEKIPFISPKG